MSRILIVGAGVSGLLAAGRLRARGHEVTVLDKGLAVGGRLATRTVGDAVFDHGAQFLTAKDPRFRAVVDGWCDAGVARRWFHGSPDRRTDDPEGHPRFRGQPTMRRIAEHLAIGTTIHLGAVVVRIGRAPTGGWDVLTTGRETSDPRELAADALLLTAPLPQSLALLDAGDVILDEAIRRRLEAIAYEPCIAVLAIPHRSPSLPARGVLRLGEGPVSWLTDNRATGASPAPSVTVHADADVSRQRWEDPDAEVARDLLAAAREQLGTDADPVHVHRWRYARPTASAGTEALIDDSHGAPIAFAGDGLLGGRVEGAALSGLHAAELLDEALSGEARSGGT